MRCKFCGSKALHQDKEHKSFSTGKAVAGAVTFGVVGAAAGLIGKDVKGYRCAACGSFMDAPMDFFTESQVDSAIRDAEAGRSRALFDYYKGQYPNIQANIPAQIPEQTKTLLPAETPLPLPPKTADTVKRSYRYGLWQPDCPIYVESVVIHEGEREDSLSLIAWNQSGQTIRSAYFRARVLDDTGDEVSSVRCVYQNLAIPGGGETSMLPADKEFPLGTDLAYRVELACEKVAFAGDEVWRAGKGAEEISLPSQPLLTRDNFPRIQYVDTRYAAMQHTPAVTGGQKGGSLSPRLFMPLEKENFWLCNCGHPVKKGEICPYCGDDWETVKDAFSQEKLRDIQQREVKKRAAQRAEITWPLYEKALAPLLEKEKQRKAEIYEQAEIKLSENTSAAVREAEKLFAGIEDWKDSREKRTACAQLIPQLEEAERLAAEKKAEEERIAAEKKAEEERIAAEKAAKKRKKTAGVVTALLLVGVAAFFLITKALLPEGNYKKADGLLKDGQYEGAITAFTALNGYKDSAARIEEAKELILEREYAAAVALLEAGKYEDAIAAFAALGSYKDSAEKAGEIKPVLFRELLRKAEVGSYVFFGSYEQDNNTANGKEDIEWLVLAKVNNSILVTSKFALDCQPYNTSFASVTWETCSLRQWLNGTFLSTAFSSGEQNSIVSTTVTADKNTSYYNTSPGNDTTDKVFLLSITEVKKYFSADSARQCQGTAYCYAQGADKASNDNCWWWLRSPGSSSYDAAYVSSVGPVYSHGFLVSQVDVAVRPALWINLGSV